MRCFPPRSIFLARLGVPLGVVAAAVVIGGCGSSPKPATTVHGAAAKLAPSARAELLAAATYLGVDVSRLQAELKGGRSLAEVAAKTPGKTEAGLIAAIARRRAGKPSKRVERRVGAQVRAHGVSSLQPLLSLREDAREYLGLSVAQLRRHAKGGKTLAQIAAEIPGHSEAGMIDAIFGARERQLEAAVKAGRLRPDVERLTLLHLRDRVRTYVRRFKVGQAPREAG